MRIWSVLTRLFLMGGLVAGFGLMISPATLLAQSNLSGLAGEVRDTSGAVLPGVTVEAASPALIERVRASVTDSRGQYKILDLSPGTYDLTFTLTGFRTLKQSGILLTSGFTATAKAELSVGTIEETVVVSGVSPLVDTHNARVQNVVTRDELETLPTAKSMAGFAAMTLGTLSTSGTTVPDVGGDKGDQHSAVTVHGTNTGDGRLLFDGMTYNQIGLSTGSGELSQYRNNSYIVEEVNIEMSGKSGSAAEPGAILNVVPKSGGNMFSGTIGYNGTSPRFQTDNNTDALRARGVADGVTLKKIYDVGGGVGGPIMRHTLWFYAALRSWGAQSYAPTAYVNSTLHTVFYTQDRTKVGYSFPNNKDVSGRLTWQATQKQRVTGHFGWQYNCNCNFGLLTSPTAPEAAIDFGATNKLNQVTWTYPISSRLLFDAGVQVLQMPFFSRPSADYGGFSNTDIAIRDLGTGYLYNANLGALGYSRDRSWGNTSTRFAMSYVTGSHAFKVGGDTLSASVKVPPYILANDSISYTFQNQVPRSVTQYASPGNSHEVLKMKLGLYVQDQWTINRFTISPALRFDYMNAYVPEQTRPGGLFVGPLTVQKIPRVPLWSDLNPRLGVAFDLFGNGKTALKGSVGRYVRNHATDIATSVNPVNSIVTSTTRIWNDTLFPVGDPRRGNFVPDCVLTNFAENGECGATDNSRFGTAQVATRYAKDVTEGFGTRDYQWQATAGVQHEFRPGLGMDFSYFRYVGGNFFATDNTLAGPEDYSHFCVTAPRDPLLPGGGGNQLCGLYDISLAKFNQVSNLVTQTSHFGKHSEITNSFDIFVSSRFGSGGQLSGGISLSKTTPDKCYIIDSPQQARPDFCHVGPGAVATTDASNPPWSAETQLKINGSYPLGWGLIASGVYQNLPGIQLLANRSFSNAEVAGSLRRNLAACGAAAVCNATVLVSMIPPGTLYEDRLSQVDVRLTKEVRVQRVNLKGMVDVYNLFNGNYVARQNYTFGSSWRTPTATMGGRLLKFGVQVVF